MFRLVDALIRDYHRFEHCVFNFKHCVFQEAKMKKNKYIWIVMVVLVLLVGCDAHEIIDNGDSTPINDHEDPYLLFEQIDNNYYMDSYIAVSTFKGPFEISEAREIVKTHAIKTENMEQAPQVFDFSSFGYDPADLNESLSFRGTYYVVNYGFEQDGDEVIVRVISVMKDLYYLPNQTNDYLDLINHPSETNIILETFEGHDIKILARSEHRLSDIMNHYLTHFSYEEWMVLSDSLNDESNEYYNSEKEGQIHLIYNQNASGFIVWLNISTLDEADEFYEKDTLFIEIRIENVKQYLID